MASITKRAGGWFVQIRRKGFEPQFRTFRVKADAERWAREREAKIDRGEEPLDRRSLRSTTLGDLIDRYVREVTPGKRSAESERLRLGKMRSHNMASLRLVDVSAAAITGYRDGRAAVVKPGTIARELGLLHTIIEVARRDWGFGIPQNVVGQVRRFPVRNARDRRLERDEFVRLRMAVSSNRNKLVAPAIYLAIETALRRGELLDLRWQYIDLQNRTAHVPHTKTGNARTVPLTDRAVAILQALPRSEERVFPMSAMALRLSWNRVRERAGMPDLRFHDLRHEAISRFAEMGLTAAELAVISGHRDPRMLMRYTHLRPADLAKKLTGRSWDGEIAVGQKSLG
jgi:integrase